MIGHILSDFLDWGPLRFLCDLTWGPPARFGVNALVIVKSDVRGLLKSYGIRSWGYDFSGDDLLFSVNKKKARWTLRVLQMHRYPVTQVPLVALKSKKRSKKWRM